MLNIIRWQFLGIALITNLHLCDTAVDSGIAGCGRPAQGVETPAIRTIARKGQVISPRNFLIALASSWRMRSAETL